MKKLIFLSSFLLLFSSAAFAQRTGSVSGQITDDATAEHLTGAVIELRSVADSTQFKHDVAGVEGKFTVANLPYGEYNLKVTFLGYIPYENKITINSRNMTLANLFMQQDATEIDEVNVVTQAIRTSMHGDTIVYNAHAFKTAEDADAEELLKQLPGVEVTADGQVTAQGKNISKIFVDGKETFGTDVTATMRNIPANMIDKVEVYNKLSDFAETTGIQDGDDYQVMNFVTGIKFAQYGDYSGLYGHKDMYAFNAQHNIVTGNHGLRINAGTNNTGQMGFGGGMFGEAFMSMGSPGMMGGGGYGGRFSMGGGGSADSKTKNHTAGLNYNYESSENFRVSFNYRYGYRDNESKRESDRTYFIDDKYPYNHVWSLSESNSRNNSHSAGAHVNWKINPKQRLSFRFDGRYQDNDTGSTSQSIASNIINELKELFWDQKSGSTNSTNSYSLNGGLNYGINSLGKQGRSLSFAINAGINRNDGDRYREFEMERPNSIPADSTSKTITGTDSKSYNIRARAQYSEPLSSTWNVLAVYDFSYRYSDDNDNMSSWDEDLQIYVPYEKGSWVMETKETSHRIGPAIYYSKNRDYLRFDVVYKYTEMTGDRILPKRYSSTESFNNFVYNINYRLQLNPQKGFDFSVSSDTNNPGIRQLQDVDDDRSYPFVSHGNPDLDPYYSHSASASYNSFNLMRSSNFNVSVNGQMTTGYIGNDVLIITKGMLNSDNEYITGNGTVLREGDQYSQPININRSSWSAGLNASYGQPLNFMKFNMNLSASANYSESPGLVQGEKNTSKNQSFSLGARLNSNISSKFTLGVNYRFSPSFVKQTHEDYSNSTNLSQNMGLNLHWRTWQDFVLRTDIGYSKTNQKIKGRDSYLVETLSGNASLGKKVFKNKRGEITFAVNDLFNQSKRTNQTVSTEYIENTKDKGIGRYFSIGFKYQLRNFQKDDTRGGDGDRMRTREGGRPSGPGDGNRPYRRMNADMRPM